MCVCVDIVNVVQVSSNSVTCYEMSNIEKQFGLSRDSLIGLALLLGCDYLPEGVHGIGRESTVKLIEEQKGVNLLERFSQWRSSEFDTAELQPAESTVYKKAMADLNFPNADVRIVCLTMESILLLWFNTCTLNTVICFIFIFVQKYFNDLH